MSKFPSFSLAFGLSAALFLGVAVSPVLAATCQQLADEAYPDQGKVASCTSQSCPGTVLSSEATDCVSGDVSQSCCVILQNQTAGPSPSATDVCGSQGGSCQQACGSGMQDMGIIDCPAFSSGGVSGQMKCCLPAGAKPTTPDASGAATLDVGKGPSLYKLLPKRTQECWKTGKCELDDIILTGTSFATLLTGLSGAAFFVTFIYGGAMYLLSFGNAKSVDKGKSAIKGAAIGMMIVLGAWTIVNYLASSLVGGA